MLLTNEANVFAIISFTFRLLVLTKQSNKMILRLMSKSRNSEINATTGRISEAFHSGGLAEDPALVNIFNEIDPTNQQLTQAIKTMKAESDLELKDEQRDVDHHALYHLVYGATFSLDNAVQAAAQKVFNILKHYGLSVTDENYDTETSYLDSLLTDLGKADLAEAVSSLESCAGRMAILQESQNIFKASRLVFQQEQAKEGTLKNATKIKMEVAGLVNDKLVTFLRGALISSPAVYSEFAATVNQIIRENNEVVKKRRTPKNGQEG